MRGAMPGRRSNPILTTLIPLSYRNVPVAVAANFAGASAVVIVLSGTITSFEITSKENLL